MFSILWLVAVVCQVTANSSSSQTGPASAEILETRVPAYSATITEISSTGVEVRASNQKRSIPFDQLLRAKFASPETKAAPNQLQVELSDGSQLRCQQLTSDGKTVQLTISDQWKVSLPSNQVANCLAIRLDATLGKQWENMVSSRIAGDVLILQRSAEALDKIEGVIVEITDAQVKFEFDGQTIPVQRTKLAGWQFFSSSKEKPGKLLAVLRDVLGNSWMIQGITAKWSPGSAAQVKLVSGATIEFPIDKISEIDFSFGSMRFLADLEPLERRVPPRLSLAVKLPEAEQLFGPRASAAEPTRGATAGPGVQFMGAGSLTVRVPTDFKRLLGSVALTPDGPQFVACKVQVFLEDKVLWEKTLDHPHDAQAIELEVEPGKRLRLVVESESKQPVGDMVTWRQLRFVK